jgi:hypothetical protein
MELNESMEFVCPPSIHPSGAQRTSLLAAAVSAAFKSRSTLQLENLVLRHQLGVLRRSVKRRE